MADKRTRDVEEMVAALERHSEGGVYRHARSEMPSADFAALTNLP